MIRSMTGFGAAELGTEHGRLSAEDPQRQSSLLRDLPSTSAIDSRLEGPVRQLLTDRWPAGRST
jgi:hypothetical protein